MLHHPLSDAIGKEAIMTDFPVKPLGRLFRNKFLCYLQEAFAAGQLTFYGQLRELGHPANFRDLVSRLAGIDWVPT
jgi:hypothetical protein